MKGTFNTDTEALKHRANLNASNAKHDLEAWILEALPSLTGLRILDLGCGVGKQLFRLAPLVTPSGSLLGVDLSAAAVMGVKERAAAEGLGHVDAVEMSLDDAVGRLPHGSFDLILSTYAIYYSRDKVALIRNLRSLLKDGGATFVCGPGRGTNDEMVALVNSLVPPGTDKLPTVPDFLTPAGIDEAATAYSRAQVSRLDNVIAFDSADAFMQWWTRHNAFVPAVEEPVRRRVQEHFASHKTFELTKNVLGVRLDA